MENWTLVYRVYAASFASRQRHTKWVSDEVMAYDELQSALQWHGPRIVGEEGRRLLISRGETVSLAYVIRPDGVKIPLLSGVPPHQILERDCFLQAAVDPRTLATRQGHVAVDRKILHRRIERLWFLLRERETAVAGVLSRVASALFWGSAHTLATACERALGPLGGAPRTCPPARGPLRRRLRALARQAQSAFPATARVLQYVEYAVAREAEKDVWAVCEPINTSTGRVWGEERSAGPEEEESATAREEHLL